MQMEAVGKRFIVREDVSSPTGDLHLEHRRRSGSINLWGVPIGFYLDSTMSELQPTGRSGLYEPGWKSE